ncbi:putative disease resistance RPP13-like protein 3 [Miscanthus floridulus]|uniref:putative disease resistance RPP13-like protein 3 n=1 Tax=Miscanthus floridulus TaxID=154761 RepID=UPI00345A26AE
MVDAAGVSVVLSKLQEVASAEVTALLKVDDQIRGLRRGLVYLQAEIRGADQRRHGLAPELLLLWAREARAVTFDVEDAVDEFQLKVEAFQVRAKSLGLTCWYGSAVKLLHGLAMQLFVRHGLSREIAKINERIEEINKVKKYYNIQSTPSKHWSLPSIDVVWHVDGGSTELRQREFEALKEQILSGAMEKLTVHPGLANISVIHGESGTGKTRLARKLYNCKEIREKFEVLAWICLPPRVRFEQIVDMILDTVRRRLRVKQEERHGDDNSTGTTAASSSPRQADVKLKVLLKGRKYLLVLDGLVDMSSWNCLLDLLPARRENPDSRVLVTTHLSEKHIKHADDPSTRLGSLDTVQTAELLRERVLFGADASASAAARDGDDVWKQEFSAERVRGVTRGLPLAVIVLGGILRTKAYPSEWKEVFADKLETPRGEPRAMRCLWSLALEELPNHLKSCFLYLATASENVLLDPARMVRLWIAEGFVAPRKGRTLEEVGLSYLRELLCRGLLELAEEDGRGGIRRVTAHGLLHSFVQAEAQESSFLEIHHDAHVLNPHAVRRLAVHNFVDSYVDIPDAFPKLRSLFCDFLEEEQDNNGDGDGGGGGGGSEQPLWPWPWHWHNPAEWLMRACGGGGHGPAAAAATKKLHQLSIIKGSRFLRVIDLYGLLLTRVPDEIGAIIHLRYLGIRNCKLSELPASIAKLENLQTLDVRKTHVRSVTDGFWEIAELRHVLADGLLLPKCPSRNLKQLQTLTAVAVAPTAPSWSPDGCCPLNRMLCLRSLTVCAIPDSTSVVRALSLALKKMEFLVSLSLSGRLLPSGVFTNPSSRHLEELALHGKLDPPPSGPFVLPNLGKLTLSGSTASLGKDFVQMLADLPNLAEMELLDGSYDERELVFHRGGFLSLTKLTLNNLAKLEVVNLNLGSVPELVVLTHCGCDKMKLYDNRSHRVSTGPKVMKRPSSMSELSAGPQVMERPPSLSQRMHSSNNVNDDESITWDGTWVDDEVTVKEKGDEVGRGKEESQENNQCVEGTNGGGTSNLIVNCEEDSEDEVEFYRF